MEGGKTMTLDRNPQIQIALCTKPSYPAVFATEGAWLPEMSKTFSACQTFGLTNFENLSDRMKTCQTEYILHHSAHIFRNIPQFLALCSIT